MNKWIKGIDIWWNENPTLDDVYVGRVKSQNEKVRKELTVSCWASDIKSLTSKVVKDVKPDGGSTCEVVYTIGIAGFKHQCRIDHATYVRLQEALSELT